jgi:hypothetical protein
MDGHYLNPQTITFEVLLQYVITVLMIKCVLDKETEKIFKGEKIVKIEEREGSDRHS